jgi:exodeoxyribonuclease V alpha subunit
LREGAGSKTVFAILEELMALCVHRNGPRGVKDVNQRIIYQLEASNVVSAGVKAYPGIPLTVARNDAALGLFNGASGL